MEFASPTEALAMGNTEGCKAGEGPQEPTRVVFLRERGASWLWLAHTAKTGISVVADPTVEAWERLQEEWESFSTGSERRHWVLSDKRAAFALGRAARKKILNTRIYEVRESVFMTAESMTGSYTLRLWKSARTTAGTFSIPLVSVGWLAVKDSGIFGANASPSAVARFVWPDRHQRSLNDREREDLGGLVIEDECLDSVVILGGGGPVCAVYLAKDKWSGGVQVRAVMTGAEDLAEPWKRFAWRVFQA